VTISRLRFLAVAGVLTVAFGGVGGAANDGHGLKRAPRVKPERTAVHGGLARGSLTLKFRDDLGVYAERGHLFYADGRVVGAVEDLLRAGTSTGARSEFEFDKSTLRLWRERGQGQTGASLADLSQYFRVTLAPRVLPEEAARICDLLNRSGDVELAFLEAVPEVAGDIAPATPDFEPQQDYLKAAPGGVDAYASWAYEGGRGEGVTVCDIEYGWRTTHEDLSKLVGNIIGGDWGSDNHGTAVMGEMVADSSISGFTGIGYGVTGICHGASAKMVSVQSRSTADALLLGAANLSVGDVLLIELHQPGPNSPNPPQGQLGFVPMEWTPSVFDAIQTITANGLIVCEAAGNGSEDLNGPAYGGWFDTTKQHSGAVLCGAGAPPPADTLVDPPDRSRLGFSNYGMRVDLQGYGIRVVTTGYGGLFNPGDTNQHYTAGFSGTSSASPIVTGSVVCIQGRFKHVSGGRTMTAKEIRDLLYATGSPQTSTVTQHIGPRPNLGAAIPLVAALSAYASPRTVNVSLLGAPHLADTLWLVNPHVGPTLFNIAVTDSLPILPLRESITQDKESLRARAPLSRAAASTWLSVSPLAGSVPGGDSVPVAIEFDAYQLVGGYFGSYHKARLDVEVNGDAGLGSLPVPVMALVQDSLHGDTVKLQTAALSLRASSETNMAGWDYNDLLTGGWLYDGSLVASRLALGDTNVYRCVFSNGLRWRGRDFWKADSSWLPNYLIWRDSAWSDDSIVGIAFEAWVPASGDSAEFVLWRASLHTNSIPIPNLRLGIVGDWDLPASSGARNLGGFDTTRQMIYQTGDAGHQDNAAGFALIRGKAYGGVVGSNPADVYPNNGFTDGRLYTQMSKPGFRVDTSNTDLYTLLTGTYDLLLQPGEVMQAELAVLSSRTGVSGLEAAWVRARALSDSLRYLSCPIAITGDFNMDGLLNSSDIILTVNFIFKNGPDPQPIALTADVNCSGQVTSADIIYLVNYVFKSGLPPCDACRLY
jgi:hypothetical protein